MESLGADEVIDYASVDFAAAVRDVDIVFDTLGGNTTGRSLEVLRPGGHLVTAAAMRDAKQAAKFEAAGMRFSGIGVDPDPVALRGIVDLVDQGKLRVHVHETFPFDRIADAHRALEAGHLQGKIALAISDQT
ncbi:hypothetical protein GCM10023350_24820 [Nocardioides endophyticus]|uniref:NADP-dependent oxidoreductase n=1 Tax=Nocardioides endophyticus TaxID=1353775 RepID=A0ABP8YX02_9ACTN